ncbi:SCL-interrupting locus protein [Clonorchis sinensis]|uniref:SCL-interrupting locus protein n=1 Tax=Clonorchis sinensis TaxID=79923 RepID=G7YWA9_CLOSI|nr:SCL-interrupting locus protein [Clonorchis sinensis]
MIFDVLEHKPSVAFGKLLNFRTQFLLNKPASPGENIATRNLIPPMCHFSVDALSIDCPLRFLRVRTPKLVSSALARSLETSLLFPVNPTQTKELIDLAVDLRFGYLSVTSSNELSVHLDSDPSALSANLAGLWISGIQFVDDPRVWAACFRFLLSKQVNRRYFNPSTPHFWSGDARRIPNVSMLLLFYGTTTGPPACFEVDWAFDFARTTQLHGTGQLHSTLDDPAVAATVFHQPSNFSKVHFNLYKGVGSVQSLAAPCFDSKEMCTFDLNLAPKHPLYGNTEAAVRPYLSPVTTLQLEGAPLTASVAVQEAETSCISPRSPTDLSKQLEYDDTFSLPATHFNVPDASLLFEEGVTTSTSGLMQSSLSQNDTQLLASQTSLQYSNDAIPRQPPGLSSVQRSSTNELPLPLLEKKPLPTICEDDVLTAYDPARYRVETENQNLKPTVEPSESSVHREKKRKPHKSTPTVLHSLLATLPPSQLKRLEQIICTLLDKSNDGQVKKEEAVSRSAGCEQTTEVLHNNVQAVDVAVNTTQLYVKPVPQLETDSVTPVENATQQLKKTDKACPGISTTCSEHIKHVRPTGANTSSNSVHRASRPTLGDFASLLSLPHSDNKQTSHPSPPGKHGSGVPDRYSNLLASIQAVLDRQSKSGTKHKQNRSISSDSHLPKADDLRPQTDFGESVCDYPLNIRSRSTTRVNGQQNSVSEQDELPVRNALLSNERVAYWLHSDMEPHPSLPKNEGDDSKTIQLSDTLLDSHLIPGRYANATCLSENNSKCTLSSSLISANLCDYHLASDQEVTPAQISIVSAQVNQQMDNQLTTETDQSLFLAALVEKYLGLKIESPKKTASDRDRRRTEEDDSMDTLTVTRYGGLNPTDMSLATQCYLERHGILDTKSESARSKKAFCSSTPLGGPSLVCLNPETERNAHRNEPHLCPPIKESPEVFHFPVNTVPNILDGLCLERSPLADPQTKCVPNTKLFPTLSEPSQFSIGTCVAVGPTTRTKLTVDQRSVGDSEHGRILDIERLRALPKLL